MFSLLYISMPLPQVSWTAARLVCACTHQAELASISAEEVNSFVSGLAGDTENTWIGEEETMMGKNCNTWVQEAMMH